MESKEYTKSSLNAIKIIFGIIILVLSGIGLFLLGNLQVMLREWSAPQYWDPEKIKIASALNPFMPILTIFNLIFLLLGVYLLIEAVQKKKS